MSPPNNEKGGSRTTGNPPTVSATTKNNHQQPSPKTGPRHVTGQLPLPAFVPAEVLVPSPGRTRVALIVRDCPRCEGVHLHVCSSPAPKVLSRRAGCGQRYDLYPFKAARRGKRAA